MNGKRGGLVSVAGVFRFDSLCFAAVWLADRRVSRVTVMDAQRCADRDDRQRLSPVSQAAIPSEYPQIDRRSECFCGVPPIAYKISRICDT